MRTPGPAVARTAALAAMVLGLACGAGTASTAVADTTPPQLPPAASPVVEPPAASPTDPATPNVTPTDAPTGPATPTDTDPATGPPSTATATPSTATPSTPTPPPDTATGSPTPTGASQPPESSSASPVPRPDRPASTPAVQSSAVTLPSVLLALAALLAAGLVVWAAYRRGRARGRAGTTPPGPVPVTEERTPPAPTVVPVDEAAALVAFLVALGEAMIDSGDSVNDVQEVLDEVARANGASSAEIVVLPTALIVSVPGVDTVQTAVAAAGTSRLRLDQIAAVFRVVAEARTGGLGPTVGLARLAAVRSTTSPYGEGQRLAGYVVLTLGLALILKASGPDLVVAGLLGLLVGILQLSAARLVTPVRVFIPVLSAFAVAVVVFTLPRSGLDVGLFAPLVAPLVTFLPGALLTTSVIELATGQMISGAARLAAGMLQLVLLALGIVAGAQLVGVPATSVGEIAASPLGELAPWIGVAVFGVGVVVHNSARWDSLGWVLLVLYVAYAAQVIGGLFLGGVLSAFVGAAAMAPVATFVATRRTGPPTLVSFLPAFWLLVPGALALVGVTQLLGADRVSGTESLVTTASTMVAIALGVLLGLAVGALLAQRAVTRGQPG